MSRWSTLDRIVAVHRPDPNSRITWALALVTSGLWAVAVLVVFAPTAVQFPMGGPVHLSALIPFAVVRAAAGIALAVADDADVRRRLGHRLADPLVSIVSPTLYLLIRMVRESDPRGGRPFWTGFAVCAGALFLLAFLAVGGF